MSKQALSHKLSQEIERLNDRIDRKIVKGKSYRKEAERHRELVRAMSRLLEETEVSVVCVRRPVHDSPVHRRLKGGSFLRLFRFNTV